MFSRKILIIEDDHDIRVCFRQSLEAQGYTVHSATNGRDGLKKLENLTPDLIVLDLSMPIMNGLDFLKHKNTDDRIKDIPVLVVTCNRDKLSLAGDIPHLIKPVEMDEFISRVKACLREQVTS